jgi:hypothetical protein
MPKLLCKCNQVLSFGPIPSPIEWRILSDERFDSFSGWVDAEDIYQATNMMLRCPNCGRLWVFWDEAANPVEYVPQPS